MIAPSLRRPLPDSVAATLREKRRYDAPHSRRVNGLGHETSSIPRQFVTTDRETIASMSAVEDHVAPAHLRLSTSAPRWCFHAVCAVPAVGLLVAASVPGFDWGTGAVAATLREKGRYVATHSRNLGLGGLQRVHQR
jgi:hypothetical protein